MDSGDKTSTPSGLHGKMNLNILGLLNDKLEIGVGEISTY